jgi:hypothetical protein
MIWFLAGIVVILFLNSVFNEPDRTPVKVSKRKTRKNGSK